MENMALSQVWKSGTPLAEPLGCISSFFTSQSYKSCTVSYALAHLPEETDNALRCQYMQGVSLLLWKVEMNFFQQRGVINLGLSFDRLSVLTPVPVVLFHCGSSIYPSRLHACSMPLVTDTLTPWILPCTKSSTTAFTDSGPASNSYLSSLHFKTKLPWLSCSELDAGSMRAEGYVLCLLNQEKAYLLCFKDVARVDLPVVQDNHSPSVTKHWEKHESYGSCDWEAAARHPSHHRVCIPSPLYSFCFFLKLHFSNFFINK